MALSLTCDCGARFEVEDTLAGQEVSCPECQHPLKVPAHGAAPPRTSLYALASAVLALVGAFTLVGTVAAVVVGVVALVSIARNRPRLTGVGFAAFGIVAGVAFTALTVVALGRGELFGFGDALRERTMADQVDLTGPTEVRGRGFSISRPSEKWGQVRDHRSDDPAVTGVQKDRALLLTRLARHAYVDVRAYGDDGFVDLHNYQSTVLEEFQPRQLGRPPRGGGWDDEDDDDGPFVAVQPPEIKKSQQLALPGDLKGREMVVEARRGGQRWQFLIRIYRKGDSPTVYVVRGYTPAKRWAQNEEELRRALDSFKIDP